MVVADYNDLLWVISFWFYILVAYLLGRGRVIRAVEKAWGFQIKGEELGKFIGIISCAFLISFQCFPQFHKVYFAFLQFNCLFQLPLKTPISCHLKDEDSVEKGYEEDEDCYYRAGEVNQPPGRTPIPFKRH